MADILKIGLSALMSQQRAIAVASNNVANASTPGYSRQRVELAERPGQRLGNDYVGNGVTVAQTRRIGDDIVAEQLHTATAGFSRSEAFVGLAEALDNLLADEQTGLNSTLQTFVNSIQDVADDPSSNAARQVLLSEARTLVSRFDTMDRRLNEIGAEAGAKLRSTTTQINALGDGIAEVNRQIILAGTTSGRSAPADLLDQRDRLLENLAQLVKVDTAEQRDGTLSVFIGSGQVFVIGGDAAELEVAPGAVDPSQPQILLRGSTTTVNITPFATGGDFGGTLDFNREMLTPARAELGRIAVGLVNTFNTAHRNGMDLQGALGGDLFGIAAPLSLSATGNLGSGSAAATITDVAQLEPTSYRLTRTATGYSLSRLDDSTAVPMTGAGSVADPLVAGGLRIVMSGTPATGDEFLLQPLSHVPGSLQVLITNPSRVAAAAPIRTRAELANRGDATISAGEVATTAQASMLSATTIEFLSPTTYSINNAGSFTYTAGADIVANGTRVQIAGAPVAGDRFVIESNAGGIGDNRNALELIDELGAAIFDSDTTSLHAAVGQLVTSVGAQTAETQNRRDAQKLLMDQTSQRLDSIRGVNLDEEAADLLRFEQMYQAAAQTIAVAGTLFDSLLMALRR